MINVRDNYVIAFFRNGISKPTLIASTTVVMNDWNLPLQPRLVLTSSPSILKFLWSCGAVSKPQFQWGTQSGVYNFTVLPTSAKYTNTDMCGPPATTNGYHDAGYILQAVFGPLQPWTRYYYIYGDSTYGFSQEASFVSPPTVGTKQEFSILAFGDMGLANSDSSLDPNGDEPPSAQTTYWMEQQLQATDSVIGAVFHIGDLSYARGFATEWDQFHYQIAPLAQSLPYQTCLGNHERDFPSGGSFYNGTDSGGECGVAASMRFPSPNTPSPNLSWYSVNYGSVHAVFMSTEDDFRNTSTQYQWLLQDLAAVDRSVTPWIIFSGHRPMYIDSTNNNAPDGDQPVAALLRQHVEPLLMEYKVDIALWGHHHSYQRMCAVYQEQCLGHSKNGVFSGPFVAPVQMVIGMAGQGMSKNIEIPQPSWVEFVDILNYGFTRIDVSPTSLCLTFFRNIDGATVDAFCIVRD